MKVQFCTISSLQERLGTWPCRKQNLYNHPLPCTRWRLVTLVLLHIDIFLYWVEYHVCLTSCSCGLCNKLIVHIFFLGFNPSLALGISYVVCLYVYRLSLSNRLEIVDTHGTCKIRRQVGRWKYVSRLMFPLLLCLSVCPSIDYNRADTWCIQNYDLSWKMRKMCRKMKNLSWSYYAHFNF